MQYMTVKQIVESGVYPFSFGQVRHYLCHRHHNGLGKAVRKIGKRVYLNKDMFEQWIESQSAKGGGL